jgi:hypothetical protein
MSGIGLNVSRALEEIGHHYTRANDPNLTGWVNWPHKQQLYEIYWAVKDALDQTSHFVGEDEWLEERKQERVMNILKGKINGSTT